MTLLKKLHKEVRSNWWFINRAPIALIMSSIFAVIIVLNIALELLEKLTN